MLKAKGTSLTLPASNPLFPQTGSLTVQLQTTNTANCWEAVFVAPAIKTTATQIKDKFP